jgi:hypothetical protein
MLSLFLGGVVIAAELYPLPAQYGTLAANFTLAHVPYIIR